jgi:hypothetical protein
MYYTGEHLRQDWNAAASLLQNPANQGDLNAQHYLGAIYIQGGFGVAANYREAARWLTRAAKQGDENSQFGIGSLYRAGYGVPKDPVLAYMWLDLAAAGGPSADQARASRDALESGMTPEQIAEAGRLVREWKPISEKQ